MRKGFIFLFIILSATLPLKVSAHATPLEYIPDGKAALSQAPSEARIHFSERIEPNASSLVIFGPSGISQEEVRSKVSANDPRLLLTAVQDEGLGTYTASWHVVSADDGHFTTGAFSWTVGTTTHAAVTTPLPTFAISHESSIPEAGSLFLELFGEALLIGSLLLVRNKKIIAGAVFITLIGSISYLALKAISLASSESVGVIVGLKEFLSTAAGRYTLWRSILTLGIGAILFLTKESHLQRKILWTIVGTIALLRALISHAAASAFYPEVGILINAIHLIAKSAWIGSASVLIILGLWKSRYFQERYSTISLWSLLIGGLTGVYIVWLHLKDASNLLSSQWGERFLLLACATALFLGIHLWRRFSSVRYLGSWYWAETSIGLGIIFLSSLLIITTPPLPKINTYPQTIASQGISLTIEDNPLADSELRISLVPERGTISSTTLLLLLENRRDGIGPLEVHPEKISEQSYKISKTIFSPQGLWDITLIASRPQSYNSEAHFEREILTAAENTAEHSQFLTTLALIAGGCVIGLFWAIKKNPEIERKYPIEESAALTALCVLILGITFGILYTTLARSSFEKSCGAHGDFWTQSVPMREGIPMSARARTGCSVGNGSGTYHFANFDEYSYFIRPRNIQTETLIPSEITTNEPVDIWVMVKEENMIPNVLIDHERIMHMVIVDDTFSTFAHIHPTEESKSETGSYHFSYPFPQNGTYLLATTFRADGNSYTNLKKITIGEKPPVSRTKIPEANTVNVDGYTISLKENSLSTLHGTPLHFHVEKNGKPVTTLTPYLGAGMHIALIKEDFTSFEHAHGSPKSGLLSFPWSKPHAHSHVILPKNFGPDLEAAVFPTTSGRYYIYAEFSDELGKTHLAKFVRNVP